MMILRGRLVVKLAAQCGPPQFREDLCSTACKDEDGATLVVLSILTLMVCAWARM